MDIPKNRQRIINDIVLVQKQLSNPNCVILNEDGRIFHAYSKSVIEMTDNILNELLKGVKSNECN